VQRSKPSSRQLSMNSEKLKGATGIQEKVISGFGDEWARLPQDRLSENERSQIFENYFSIFPWQRLPEDGGTGADIGCGSGRWAALVAPKVKRLHAVDGSQKALDVAKTNLSKYGNIQFHHATVDKLPFRKNSLNFAYCLGVLHAVPDTAEAIKSISKTLRPGAPFLLYLYYKFDNRPLWYRLCWHLSTLFRFLISRLPYIARYALTQVIALLIYWPAARSAKLLEAIGSCPDAWPLAYYRDKSLYVMRTDALDRFGTLLEKRFTRPEIQSMLADAGFEEVRFSNRPPYWCVIGIKKT
jgi:SAM-dependent methyltransferase